MSIVVNGWSAVCSGSIFFFKQMTAYELRISDWSSDVCSSDLVWKLLGKLSNFGKSAQDIVSKVENGSKSTLLSQSNFFESLNLRYFGPVDGHDVDHLVTILQDLKNIKGPKILHCVTVKGKGFAPAEKGNAKIGRASCRERVCQ